MLNFNIGDIGTGAVSQKMTPAGPYAQSFGAMPDKTPYQSMDVKSLCVGGEPKFDVDKREDMNQFAKIGLKALQTTGGGAGTAGYAMVPIYVDPRVVDTTRKYTPAVEIISRVTNFGMFADYNQVTAKGGGFCAAEMASMAEKDNTFDRQSTPIKFLYAVGLVSGPSISAMPSWILQGMQPQGGAVGAFSDQTALNAKQLEVLIQTRAIRELEENLIFNGNVSSSGIAGNPTGTEYDGVIALQSTTNKVDKNTTALDLNDYNKAIKLAFDDGGRPNIGFCSSGVFTDTLNLLTAKIGYMNPTRQVAWGFSTIVLHTMVGDVPLVPSMYLSNVSGSKACYLLDLSVWEMRLLQDLTYEELAKTLDGEKFMLKIYEALICKNSAFNAWIGEISA